MTASTQAPSGSVAASLVQAYVGRHGLLAGTGDAARFDEMATADGDLHPGWADLATAVDGIGNAGLRELRTRVDRFLEDDGVTYTPMVGAPAIGGTGQSDVPVGSDLPDAITAADGGSIGDGPTEPVVQRWRLDPLPLIIEPAEWGRLEAGLIQRSMLLDAILTDLYGEQTLITRGLIPPELVFEHDHYLRAAHGIRIPGAHQLFFHAADVYRGSDGDVRVLGDRTQAPSGAGYAMADRRVVSKVLPEAFRRSAPRGLSAYFHTVRLALESVAPTAAEEPRVVVLSPGTHSETAFDQAAMATLLGLPLVESADLTIRGGRLWMRSLGRYEPVDVVVRRVDALWSDPLALRPDSHLGVVGLTEACRRGTVTVVNTIGSGVLENPGLLPFLPALSQALLSEPLALTSAPTFWCGRYRERSHVLANLDSMIIRPTGRGASVVPSLLSAKARVTLAERISAQPTRWVGQQVDAFSEAPIATSTGLAPRQVGMRLYSVAHRSGYVPMPGALGRVLAADPRPGQSARAGVAKDVWVRSDNQDTGVTRPDRAWVEDGPLVEPIRSESAASPRVLEDMFWLGRYAERTEDLTRLLMEVRQRSDDFRFRSGHEGAGCVPVLLAATVRVTGRSVPAGSTGEPGSWLRWLTLDGAAPGTVAQSLAGLADAARSVRDQLSGDTWMVLAGVDRAMAALAVDDADAAALADPGALAGAQTAVLSGMLALSGLATENMVRDPGWHLMDIGRRLERAQQLTVLLEATLVEARSAAVDSLVVESVLSTAESGITYRRRYRGRTQIGTVLELLLLDPGNPRSVAYQIARMEEGLQSLPDPSGTSRPERLLRDLAATLRRCRPAALDDVHPDDGPVGHRRTLEEFLTGLNDSLRAFGDALTAQHFWHQRAMRSLGRPSPVDER